MDQESLALTSKQLLQFDLFRDLAEHSVPLDDLCATVKRENFFMRDFIIEEKVTDSRVHFLVSGKVEINKINENGVIVVIARVDSATHPYFGESALLGHFARNANIVAQSQCQTLSLAAKDFEEFIERHPWVGASIYRSLAKILFDRLTKANRDVMIASAHK
jgi:CRP-like cAMP-binding protein